MDYLAYQGRNSYQSQGVPSHPLSDSGMKGPVAGLRIRGMAYFKFNPSHQSLPPRGMTQGKDGHKLRLAYNPVGTKCPIAISETRSSLLYHMHFATRCGYVSQRVKYPTPRLV